MIPGYCIQCSRHVDDIAVCNGCPSCDYGKNANIAWCCRDADQVMVSINWYELMLMAIWAERWGHEKCGGAGDIYSICERIYKQHPEKAKQTPLTLAGQIDQVKDEFGPDNVQTNIPGVE